MHFTESRGRPRKVSDLQRLEMWRLYTKSGLGYILIGRKLNIASDTVRYHINQIKKKEKELYDLLLLSNTKSTS